MQVQQTLGLVAELAEDEADGVEQTCFAWRIHGRPALLQLLQQRGEVHGVNMPCRLRKGIVEQLGLVRAGHIGDVADSKKLPQGVAVRQLMVAQ